MISAGNTGAVMATAKMVQGVVPGVERPALVGIFPTMEKKPVVLRITGERMGKKMVALITDMDQPLGLKVGNALEVEECIEVMSGGGPADLREVSVELAAWMFYLAARTSSVDEGRALAHSLIRDHSALKKFREIVAEQGGDPGAIDDPARLPKAQHRTQVLSPASGFVESIQCEQVGIASLMLGGGREKKEDLIDPAVGLVLHKKVGEAVREGEALCTVHYNSDVRLSSAQSLLQQAYRVAPKAPAEKRPLIHRVISGKRAQT
jgi:thymidine phosphorylase